MTPRRPFGISPGQIDSGGVPGGGTLRTDSYPRMSSGNATSYPMPIQSSAMHNSVSAPMLSSMTPTMPPPVVPQQVRAPMIGGAGVQDQIATGQMKIKAAQNIRDNPGTSAPPQHISSSNGISDQVARQMYKVAMDNNKGDLAAGEAEFHQTMASHNVNGKALLEHWHGAPQTSFPMTPATTSVQSTPYSMLGTDKAGGTAPPMMPSGYVNAASTSPPMFGPKSGYTPLGHDMQLPSTAETVRASTTQGAAESRNMLPLLATRDRNQIHYTPQDAQRNRANEADRLQIVGEQQINNAPPTDREQFQAGTEIANTAASIPGQIVASRNQTAKDIAGARDQSQERIAQGHDKAHVDASKNRGGAGGGVTPQVLQATLGHFSQATVPDGKGGIRFATPEEATRLAYGFHGMQPPSTQPSGAPATQPSTQPTAQPTAQAAPATQPSDPYDAGGMVKVISPEGQPGNIPANAVDAAIKRGFKRAG